VVDGVEGPAFHTVLGETLTPAGDGFAYIVREPDKGVTGGDDDPALPYYVVVDGRRYGPYWFFVDWDVDKPIHVTPDGWLVAYEVAGTRLGLGPVVMVNHLPTKLVGVPILSAIT
jgi:hypothetical protein